VKETLYVQATVITLDPDTPEAEALLVRDGRITAVGSQKQLRTLAGSACEEINLGGKTVVPGFNDNHLHTVILGDHTSIPSLRGLSEQEIIEQLRERYADAAPGELIIAYEWDYPSCPNPRKEILDRYFPENPVYLVQFSGHGAWLNSRALSRLGITGSSGDPKRGSVLRDENGEPTGIVRELSGNRIIQGHFLRMHWNRRLRQQRLHTALDMYRRHGITSVQDNSWYFPTVLGLRQLRRKGKLTTRFSCWPKGDHPWHALAMRLPLYDGEWMHLGPWKYILDGSFSTHTAWLIEPYADTPSTSGAPNGDTRFFERALRDNVRRKRQAAYHAIGDRTVRQFLDTLESLLSRYPWVPSLRLRLEHAQLVQPDDIKRIRDLGVLVAAQPHAMGNPEKDQKLLGASRAASAYPYRSLIDAGVHLSFGSDIPGEATFDPLYGIHLAVNRDSAEAITVEEALRAYTIESAYAEFREDVKGTLSPGKYADFTVLSANPLLVPPAEIKNIDVERSVTGGNTVYRKEE